MDTSSYNIVMLDRGGISADSLDWTFFSKHFPDCTFYEHSTPEEAEVRVKDANIVLTNKGQLHREAIMGADKLKLVSVLATGYNIIDLDAAKEKEVTVCNVASYSTASVVQHVFMLMTNLMTQFPHYHADVQAGKWQRSTQFAILDYPTYELDGKTLGIVGYGELGQAVAKVAEAFGMKVLIAERKGADELREGRTAFNEVIAKSDILTFHCPLTEQTKDTVSTEELKAMKKSAFLINTARGGVVNEAALAQALQTGEIAGAGVDVLSTEPPTPDNPLLQDVPNLLLTPHIAWAGIEAQQRLLDQTVRNVLAFLDGKPVNVVSQTACKNCCNSL